MFMDEVISKWGFGSGLSLFIAAGVSKNLFVTTFSLLASPTNPNIATGAIPALFQSLAIGDKITAGLMLSGVLATIYVFKLNNTKAPPPLTQNNKNKHAKTRHRAPGYPPPHRPQKTPNMNKTKPTMTRTTRGTNRVTGPLSKPASGAEILLKLLPPSSKITQRNGFGEPRRSERNPPG